MAGGQPKVFTGARVVGLTKITRALTDLGVELDDLKDAMAEVSTEGARVVSGFVPKRSGNLASSVRGNRAKNKAAVIVGRARVPYAGAINYGWDTRRASHWNGRPRARGGWPMSIKPSHFLQRGEQVMTDRAPDILEDNYLKIIKKVGL